MRLRWSTIGAVAALGALGAAVTVVPAAQATPPALEIVLNGEDNRLNVYDAATGAKRVLIPSNADAPGVGLDINAELCFVPDGTPWKPPGQIWFIAGEDTGQENDRSQIGWGIFRLTGRSWDDLGAEQVGKLVPDSYATTEASNPENFGCGVLPDGRVVTGDVGDQLPHEPATGQLIVWFVDGSVLAPDPGGDRNDFVRVPHCKVDVALGTAGGIEVDGTDVYVASNRPNLQTGELGGIYRYDTAAWPVAPEPACDGGDEVLPAARAGKSLFIPQAVSGTFTPSDIVDSGRGTFYVSSVFTGQVAEYGRDGLFRRFVVLTTGQLGGITPFGIGVTSDGSLWIADIGVQGPGPAPDQGSVVRVRFDALGNPGPLEVVDEGLQFPDGIGTAVVKG